MTVELPEDLAEQLADWFGIYGGCKNICESDDNCTYDKNKPFCCRQGFVGAITERIKESVDNELKIESAQLK